MYEDVHEFSARTIAGLIRDKKISARAVVEHFLERIERLNPMINAVIALAPDALARASEADVRAASGERLGPLHGVPFTVKDTIAVAGLPLTAGSRALEAFVPEETAPAVQRLLDAGAILLGKTNCSEFAVDTHTGNLLFGDTRNPWDLERTSGGSSGGESAAVAAGLAAFGVGTDFGGSIRWPAHCTGTASLRPTIGLIPGTGTLPFPCDGKLKAPNSMSLLHRFMTIGPLVRKVEDLGFLLEIMAGPDALDSLSVPVTVGDPGQVDVEALTVSWCAGEGSVPVRRDIQAAVARAAESLIGSVKSVRNEQPPGLERAADLFLRLRDAEGLPEVQALVEGKSESVTPNIISYLNKTTPSHSIEAMLMLASLRDQVRAAILGFMSSSEILLLPVASVTAPLIGSTSCDVDGEETPWSVLGSCCRAISILGFPSAVVPCGLGTDGMPIGLQIVGRPFRDDQVLAIAAVLQERLGVFRAPLFALTDEQSGKVLA